MLRDGLGEEVNLGPIAVAQSSERVSTLTMIDTDPSSEGTISNLIEPEHEKGIRRGYGPAIYKVLGP